MKTSNFETVKNELLSKAREIYKESGSIFTTMTTIRTMYHEYTRTINMSASEYLTSWRIIERIIAEEV